MWRPPRWSNLIFFIDKTQRFVVVTGMHSQLSLEVRGRGLARRSLTFRSRSWLVLSLCSLGHVALPSVLLYPVLGSDIRRGWLHGQGAQS